MIVARAIHKENGLADTAYNGERPSQAGNGSFVQCSKAETASGCGPRSLAGWGRFAYYGQTPSVPALRAGQVVDAPGTYYSPHGTFRVVVSNTGDGLVCITKQPRVNQVSLLNLFSRTYAGGQPNYFEAERDWFFCFDDYERFWLCIGAYDRRLGSPRKLPSAGTHPYAASVVLEGEFFSGRSRPFTGGSVITATGTWEGVPHEFLERVLKVSRSDWGPGASIPASPPQFTPSQRRAIAIRASALRSSLWRRLLRTILPPKRTPAKGVKIRALRSPVRQSPSGE